MFSIGDEVLSIRTRAKGTVVELIDSEKRCKVEFASDDERWLPWSELSSTRSASSTPSQQANEQKPVAHGLTRFDSLEEVKEFLQRDSNSKAWFDKSARCWVVTPRKRKLSRPIDPKGFTAKMAKHEGAGTNSEPVRSRPTSQTPNPEAIADLEKRRLELKSQLTRVSGVGKNLGHFNPNVDTFDAVRALEWQRELEAIEEELSQVVGLKFWQLSNSTYD